MWKKVLNWLCRHFSSSQRERRAIESCYQCLYEWLDNQTGKGYNIRKCSGENRWEVRVNDFTDVYLFFGKLAMAVHSRVEIYKRNPAIRYHCPFPGTSFAMRLKECPKHEKRLAIIRNAHIRISFVQNSNNLSNK